MIDHYHTRTNFIVKWMHQVRTRRPNVMIIWCGPTLRGTTDMQLVKTCCSSTLRFHRPLRKAGLFPNRPEGVRGVSRHSNKHTPRNNPEVQGAFKILMIHWILQFALRIAFRCVLHRCGSQDIRRWKLYLFRQCPRRKSKNFFNKKCLQPRSLCTGHSTRL